MGQQQRLRSLRGIKRMAGLSAGGEPQGQHGQRRSLQPPQQSQDLLVTPSPTAPIAPAEPQGRVGLPGQGQHAPAQPGVGLSPHRISAAAQHRRRGRHA